MIEAEDNSQYLGQYAMAPYDETEQKAHDFSRGMNANIVMLAPMF